MGFRMNVKMFKIALGLQFLFLQQFILLTAMQRKQFHKIVLGKKSNDTYREMVEIDVVWCSVLCSIDIKCLAFNYGIINDDQVSNLNCKGLGMEIAKINYGYRLWHRHSNVNYWRKKFKANPSF